MPLASSIAGTFLLACPFHCRKPWQKLKIPLSDLVRFIWIQATFLALPAVTPCMYARDTFYSGFGEGWVCSARINGSLYRRRSRMKAEGSVYSMMQVFHDRILHWRRRKVYKVEERLDEEAVLLCCAPGVRRYIKASAGYKFTKSQYMLKRCSSVLHFMIDATTIQILDLLSETKSDMLLQLHRKKIKKIKARHRRARGHTRHQWFCWLSIYKTMQKKPKQYL